ncbi:MAG: hypothetical protein Unbinned6354contig1000_41 [Prokaryotic dsDNA virus sp.]|nr:hypothetical protein [Cytophagaceae bacterium]QDP54338.1 MAG: hypothetical protein Unbinned6354contig1000_41 [Prokaryotic dsDNA virus sp.]|tara:strand:- start:264 stop:596 length:333 start_codon:yes stop_codon:yes gene_type:complete
MSKESEVIEKEIGPLPDRVMDLCEENGIAYTFTTGYKSPDTDQDVVSASIGLQESTTVGGVYELATLKYMMELGFGPSFGIDEDLIEQAETAVNESLASEEYIPANRTLN